MITLERNDDGWLMKCPATGEQRQLSGKKSALLSLILANAGYEVRPDFHPCEPFTAESLERGSADVPR